MKFLVNKKNFIYLLIFFSILKIFISYNFGDNFYDMEWAIIVKNLINNFTFSYHEINGQKVPTAYMPPLYAYILYFFSTFGLSEFWTVKLVLFLQCLFSGVSTFFFYKILKKYFDEKASIIFSIIFFLFPLNFYSATQISSVSFQISIFILFLFYFLNSTSPLDFFKLGIFAGLATLIRGEFWLLFLILILFKLLVKKNKFKDYFILVATFLLIISPTTIRNFIVFEELVITKSSGYNLWRGNSKSLNINGENIETYEIEKQKKYLKQRLIKEKKLNKYEIYLDKIYLNEAYKNIKNDTEQYIYHYFKKLLAFSFFNFSSNYPNYFHPVVFIPEIIISIFGIIGIFQNLISKKINFELQIITFYYLALIPVFFVLPRYKLFILPLYIIFSAYLFTFLSNKIFSKKQ